MLVFHWVGDVLMLDSGELTHEISWGWHRDLRYHSATVETFTCGQWQLTTTYTNMKVLFPWTLDVGRLVFATEGLWSTGTGWQGSNIRWMQVSARFIVPYKPLGMLSHVVLDTLLVLSIHINMSAKARVDGDPRLSHT